MTEKLRALAAREDGVTIMEVIVAMTAGMIVLMGVFMLFDLSVKQSASALDRVEADQHGRIAMERLVQELHSSCVAAPVTPVLAGSDNNNLKFVSEAGSFTVATPDEHVVTFSSGTGQLVDYDFANTGGNSSTTWTFSATPTSKVLASNVSQRLVLNPPNPPIPQPVFQYYAYNGTQISTTPLPVPLSSSDAANTVEVTIDFAAGPSDLSPQPDRTINLTDAVVLRYIPASGSTTIANPPCQ